MTEVSLRFVAKIVTEALIHFVWQGALLMLILLIVVKMFSVTSARQRYLLSVFTLLMMGMAPCLTIVLSIEDVPRSRNSLSKEQVTAAESAVNAVFPIGGTEADTGQSTGWSTNFESSILIGWLVGVAVLGTRLAFGFSITLWMRAATMPLSIEFEKRVISLSHRLKLNAHQRVFSCSRIGQAVAVGFVRPVVLIPAAWLTQLAPDVIEAVIAHELAHIRRWDLWINLIQRIIETLLFFHPAVWWLSRRIQLEREMCCDEMAAECFDRATYARSLESVARMAHGNLVLATSIIGEKKMTLLRRIRYVLGKGSHDTANNSWAAGALALIVPITVAAAFALTNVPKSSSVAMADDVKTNVEQSNTANEVGLKELELKLENEVKSTQSALANEIKSLATNPTPAAAEISTDISALEQRIEQLRQKINNLKQENKPSSNTNENASLSQFFRNRIPFELGLTQTRLDGSIVINEVWGTRPKIEVGGQYLVRGKYKLPPGQRGKLYFYVTSSSPSGATANLDLQSTTLNDQEGEFSLIHGMAVPGYFHLILTDHDKYSNYFANVYFGTGDNVYRPK